MDLSIFLAKLLGIYLLIMTADLLFRRKEVEGAVKDFATSKGLLVFAGSASLGFGLAIVIAHPIYESSWRLVVTLMGYLMIFRGICRVAFPSHLQKKIVGCFRDRYWTILAVMLILGLYLTYWGFTAIPQVQM